MGHLGSREPSSPASPGNPGRGLQCHPHGNAPRAAALEPAGPRACAGRGGSGPGESPGRLECSPGEPSAMASAAPRMAGQGGSSPAPEETETAVRVSCVRKGWKPNGVRARWIRSRPAPPDATCVRSRSLHSDAFPRLPAGMQRWEHRSCWSACGGVPGHAHTARKGSAQSIAARLSLFFF